MAKLVFIAEKVNVPTFDTEKLERWLYDVIKSHGREPGNLTYIFCDDEYILDVNKKFLQHDYYTDIITFDYSTHRRVSGDMVISLDTVRSNSVLFGKPYPNELLRVVVHGVLHLCGINDKGPGEREIMEHHEDMALAMLPQDIYLHDYETQL